MLISFLVLLYLVIAAEYYEKSWAYPEVFIALFEEQKGVTLTGGQRFFVNACYIWTCFLWPIYGRRLKKFWK